MVSESWLEDYIVHNACMLVMGRGGWGGGGGGGGGGNGGGHPRMIQL